MDSTVLDKVIDNHLRPNFTYNDEKLDFEENYFLVIFFELA